MNFKKRTLAYVTAVLAVVLSGNTEARSLNEILANKTMVVGVGATVPPLQYKLGNLLTGYEVDVIRAIGAEMGVEIVFRENSDISGLHDLLKSGELDAVIGDVAITTTNERSFDVTSKYACLGASVLSFTPGINTTKDLYGKKVGVTKGTVFESFLDKLPKEVTVKKYDTQNGLGADWMGRNIDAIVAWGAIRPYLNTARKMNLPETPVLWRIPVGILVQNNNPTLRSRINNVLLKLNANGKLADLDRKYFPDEDLRCKG